MIQYLHTMKLVLLLSLLVFPFIYPSDLLASELIDRFHTTYTINQDGSVEVLEEISYQTEQPRRGILRYIPLAYSSGFLFDRIEVSSIAVTDAQLEPLRFEQFHQQGNLVLRIGDPNHAYSGTHTYRIRYTVDNVLRSFDDSLEFYWDVTGEGWDIPIASASATVQSQHAPITRIECFSGEIGSDDGMCQSEILNQSTANFGYNHTIGYGDNLTIVVGLELNQSVIDHSPTATFLRRVRDNLWLGLIPIPLLAMFWIWYKKGRDIVFISDNIFDLDPNRPTKLRPVFGFRRTPMVYQPIHSLTPSEAGTIIDERVDNQDIIAEIIQLAHLGYLKIENLKSGRIFKRTDYKFVKLKDSSDQLAEHQKYLHDQIFKVNDEVLLSKLKGNFHTTMNQVTQMIYSGLTEKRLFTANPNSTRVGYGILAGVLVAGCVIGTVWLSPIVNPVPILAVAWQALLVPFFAFAMVQKTAIGSNYYLQAKGLRETIRRGGWRSKIHERNLFIEEVLPFAVAFGVVNQLARDMERLNLKPPQYVDGMVASGAIWSSQLNSFNSSAVNNLNFNPSSSSTSGGSGFSGGSSGGGFGGGGGSSW